MRLTLVFPDQSECDAVTPPTGEYAAFPCDCPHCGSPARVAGNGHRWNESEQRHECDAYCITCKGRVGEVHATSGTVFGRDDDAAALSGRYGKVF